MMSVAIVLVALDAIYRLGALDSPTLAKFKLLKRLHRTCTGVQSINFGLAQSFSQPLNFVLVWLFHAFCPSFSGCRAGSQ